LLITETERNVMAALPIIGLSSRATKGQKNTSAAAITAWLDEWPGISSLRPVTRPVRIHYSADGGGGVPRSLLKNPA
jgi:hypothetical protein